MNMNNEFSKGDRVVFNTRCVDSFSGINVEQGDGGIVHRVDKYGNIMVQLDKPAFICVRKDDIADVDSSTRNEQFVSDFKALLERYNAVIKVDSWRMVFDDRNYPCIDLDVIFEGDYMGVVFQNICGDIITADNLKKRSFGKSFRK